MEHVRKGLSCAAANEMDLVDYLATIGIEPEKIKGNEYWYISPFRDENSPSFKVDRKLNRWFDHGEGKGGKLVDFAIGYNKCSVAELLRKLSGSIGLKIPDKKEVYITTSVKNHIEITGVKPLTNPSLLQYGQSRGISIDLLQKFCEEVSYNNGGKNYYAIGFKNDLGGYELRSKYFKGSNSPKGLTHLSNGHSNIAVFEGFFNFLSFQQHLKNNSLPKTDFLILNSLSFFEKAREVMESYKAVNLYLDNNIAGQKFTANACLLSKAYQNKSSLYESFEDLNDFLRSQPKEMADIPKQKRRLRL